jgi:hypothetical protein
VPASAILPRRRAGSFVRSQPRQISRAAGGDDVAARFAGWYLLINKVFERGTNGINSANEMAHIVNHEHEGATN